jgi:hypothetical protein
MGFSESHVWLSQKKKKMLHYVQKRTCGTPYDHWHNYYLNLIYARVVSFVRAAPDLLLLGNLMSAPNTHIHTHTHTLTHTHVCCC